MEESPQDAFWTWSDLLLFLALGIPAFVATFLLVRFAMAPLTGTKAVLLMVPQFLGQAAMLGPLALLFRWKYEQSLLSALRLGVRTREVFPSLSSGVALAFSVLLLAVALRTPELPSPMQDLMNDPGSAKWVAVLAVSIGPAFEEIFFRGLLQPVAARTFGVVGGILLAAVPFSLLHGPQYAWSWRHILLIALAGSAFGWWRMRTRSTGASVIMHAGYNAVLVVGYMIGKSAL